MRLTAFRLVAALLAQRPGCVAPLLAQRPEGVTPDEAHVVEVVAREHAHTLGQTFAHRDLGRGMGVAIGRLREDSVYQYKFVCLSHNTVRGAAGGAVLIAELMQAEGILTTR